MLADADLLAKPFFVAPFILAGKSRNVRLTASAVTALHRLIAIHAVPDDILNDVLDTLRACADAGPDVQLKVLQALPALFSQYLISGPLTKKALEIAFLLYKSKASIISNTAAATLQQLTLATFEKVAQSSPHQTTISAHGRTITVSVFVADAWYLLIDICLLTAGSAPEYLPEASLDPPFGLEVLEGVLVGKQESSEILEAIEVCLIPLLIEILSKSTSFRILIRAFRILATLTRYYLASLSSSIETCIVLVNQLAETTTNPLWSRVLALEWYRDLCTDFPLEIFGQISFGVLVRIVAEIPLTVHEEICLPRQSPCLGMLEKADAPTLSPTYPYSLVLDLLCSLMDGLARAVQDSVSIVEFVENAWPSMLIIADTFFKSPLDADAHRLLVRSFQKFAQAAGLIGLLAARDAALTNLSSLALEGPIDDRNLLCLRALLNLAISLGSDLGSSWKLILEPLIARDILAEERPECQSAASTAHKLCRSTQRLDTSDFLDLTDCLEQLIHINASETKAGLAEQSIFSILRLVEQLSQHNTDRFSQDETAWDPFSKNIETIMFSAKYDLVAQKSAEILCSAARRFASPDRALYALSRAYPAGNLRLTFQNYIQEIIETRGESILNWSTVMLMLSRTFKSSPGHDFVAQEVEGSVDVLQKSFRLVELVHSEYFGAFLPKQQKELIHLIFLFTMQHDDLNIALTSMTILQSLAHQMCQETPIFSDSVHAYRKNHQPTGQGIAFPLHDSFVERQLTASCPADLWLDLVFYFALNACNTRPEIREGSIPMLFGVLSSSSSFPAATLATVLELVLLPLLRSFQSMDEIDNKCAERIVQGVFSLAAEWSSVTQDPSWPQIRYGLVKAADIYLQLKRLGISQQVFHGLSEWIESVSGSLTSDLWELWLDHNPAIQGCASNEAAVREYLRLLRSLQIKLPLPRSESGNPDGIIVNDSKEAMNPPDGSVPPILAQLDQVLLQTDPLPYSSPQNLSPAQSLALEALQALDQRDLRVFLFVQRVMLLTCSSDQFAVWSRECISVIVSAVTNFSQKEILSSLAALCRLIALKKNTQRVRDCGTWQQATTAAHQLLKLLTPSFATNQGEAWDIILETMSLVLDEDCFGTEDFDVQAALSIHQLLLPYLHEPRYFTLIFRYSLIHEPHVADVPDDLDEIASKIHEKQWRLTRSNGTKPRDGQIRYLPPCRRRKLAYCLMDTLFSLAENQATAAMAVPYMLLRCEVVLKAYILDQPVRGTMLQPMSQREELLYILAKMKDLKTLPNTVPGIRSNRSRDHAHLYALYPKLLAALEVEDDKVESAIRGLMSTMSADWYLDSET